MPNKIHNDPGLLYPKVVRTCRTCYSKLNKRKEKEFLPDL
uniref:Cathepsin B-like n=1 Tax=Rhizophora mucronata TaxID=61149 RepID=A0A2P2KCR7_RHIMU